MGRKMNPKTMSLRVGLKVKIKQWAYEPDFWDDDGDMQRLAKGGKTYTISESIKGGTYRLEGLIWTWRYKDLVLLDAGADDPNLAFIIKRCT
jgi:hypothetical protein